MIAYTVPLFLRGQLITDDLVPFDARIGASQFQAPDMAKYAELLPLRSPAEMSDLYQLSFDEILDVLAALGEALDFESNAHLQEAYEASLVANVLPAEMLKNSYRVLPPLFSRDNVTEIAHSQVGLDYLNGWVPHRLRDGRELRVRAFGSRTLHIPAGNGGLVSAVTILRSVITRSDAIIKAPSNDPLTAIAIARTLADVAPDHPITKHLAVGYWKGGDVAVEESLYQPHHIEKIVAWGGLASVKHVTRYIQPGLELIALDPKRSATIIGREAFADDDTLREVARRAATDIGVANQEGCANARVIYVLSGTDAEGLAHANRLGELIYSELVALPAVVSTPPRYPSRELCDHVEASRMAEDFYRVIGGERREGAIVVSQFDEPVDYSPMLTGRVANIVPVDNIDKVTAAVNAYTQTIGIYPESLKRRLRDTLPLFGAQRLTSLGYACSVAVAMPQDAIEPIRRMCKWIVDEECDPAVVVPLWQLTPA
ncbi:MAG: long-chain-fatty-acyl-CoA reductase [Mycobacterium sp.]|uniref:acyl-CoA reductase n=1 Tax=Mycobacterium sp. TaxID=1785 RepID=UPI001ED1A8FD|nr:acyl-CoA reductase [Mycobacterium sp.]MBV8785377.1 long-chain-fatty-acyl-CoA reductase [Mycobacterium sp.]